MLSRHRVLPGLLCALLPLLVALPGCARRHGAPSALPGELPAEQAVAPGVVFRRFAAGDSLSGASDAFVLDVDLAARGVRVRVVAENAAPNRGPVYADSRPVRDWCARYRAVGGVNGGFFGLTDGERKEVIGLLATGGVLRSSGRVVRAGGRRRIRCVLGFEADGRPRIGWIVGVRGRAALLTDYAAPGDAGRSCYWSAESAVACGPRLIAGGRTRITDREERLASPPPLRRTFVGYSMERGRPRHLVMGVGLSMTFSDAADFLHRYFRQRHAAACAEAMALDGGASSQLVFRAPGGYTDAVSTGVTVPTALLVTAPDFPP